MRGAALKLGQVLSIQEDQLIPEPIKKAFEDSRDFSFKMPKEQLDQLLREELGSDWQMRMFNDFDFSPFAAASIGQVHKGEMNLYIDEDEKLVNASNDDDSQSTVLTSNKIILFKTKIITKRSSSENPIPRCEHFN
jgi:hypothetical protein